MSRAGAWRRVPPSPTASRHWRWPKPAAPRCAAAARFRFQDIDVDSRHKVVLIGAGRIGRIHAGNAARHARIALAGVVDAVDAAAQSLAGEWGVPVTTLDAALAD